MSATDRPPAATHDASGRAPHPGKGVRKRRKVSLPAGAALVVGLAVASACTSSSEAPADAGSDAEPGATGIGDPYYPEDGNGGYDVGHYQLEIRYDPATDHLAGTATIEATATQDLAAFNLDLSGLEVTSVTVDGEPASADHAEGELTVTPAESLTEDAGFTTVIAYEGVPETLADELGPQGFFHTSDGALAVGQPDVAATWFPANDHPRDAASVEVVVTVPETLAAISNGELLDTTTEDGWTTWKWSAEDPMAPYLATLAIGEFDVRAYEVDGIRYWDAVDPALVQQSGPAGSYAAVATAALARQPEMIAFLSDVFGPYPFDVAGGIVDDVPELTFALENQTRPVYSPSLLSDPGSMEITVVHELAHQWAGDSVRLGAWQHIWLNEGFASYAEALWTEHEGGPTAQEQFDLQADTPEEDRFWSLAIGDPGASSAQLFDVAVYVRGAMTLHALRMEIGNELFSELITRWLADQAGQAVTTDDFIALAEEISGSDLGEFFEEWLGEGKPASLG